MNINPSPIHLLMSPDSIYQTRLLALKKEHKLLLSKKNALGFLRLGSILAIIAAFYFLYSFGWMYVVGACIVLLFLFSRLIIRDVKNKEAIQHLLHLIQINEEEILALQQQYKQFDDGAQLQPKVHDYANDMDIFGQASLFQMLNRTTSDMGANTLGNWLLFPAAKNNILERQTAVKELREKLLWRQHLQALGKEKRISTSTQTRLENWLQAPNAFIGFQPWKWLRIVLPAIMIGISIAAYFDVVSMNVFYGGLFIFAIIAFQINKVVSPIHVQLSKMVDELEALSKSIDSIEKEKFNSPLLQLMQKQFIHPTDNASQQLKQLHKILDRLDLRYNIVLSAPLNLWLLWNLQQVLDLEKWKQQHTESIHHWFEALGQFESLNCFANLQFNYPHWCYPILKEAHFSINATELGHPLIPENKRVNNKINIDYRGEIMLITGSNMAGKSTYLRSVGINVILAMAGAPVCAKSFSISPVQLISSMRIADNLEESTSTFYAELKKLKNVIDKVNANEPVFVLLDEILRGTNSLDRHTGSVALVKQLIKQKAAAIIATHDVALAELKNQFPQHILNFHFDVQVDKEELHFDYLLKEGVCTSLNASILMKKIGIEL